MATNKPISDQDINSKIDALDEPVEEEDVKSEEDSAEEEPKEDEAESKDGDAEETGEDAGEAEETEDEGYTIDGDEEEEEPETPGVTAEQKANLNPEQQYILDNLKPITIRGDVNGKTETFEVYDPSQLPAGFKYLDEREMSIAVKSFNMLEAQAERLQNEFRNQESQKVAREFKEREDNADRADIGKLQREGEIPKFKTAPNTKEFDSDPATVLIQEVLDYKEETNNRYMKEYEAGRPYKHIGFEEAFKMYQRENPTKGNAAQKAEDEARSNLAKKASRSKGSESNQVLQKPRVHSGMGSRDLDMLIDSLDW